MPTNETAFLVIFIGFAMLFIGVLSIGIGWLMIR